MTSRHRRKLLPPNARRTRRECAKNIVAEHTGARQRRVCGAVKQVTIRIGPALALNAIAYSSLTRGTHMADNNAERPSPALGFGYEVQKGDSLSKIAKHVYGDATRWKEIWEMNKASIPNPDLIHPGQQLSMPPR
jgi:nucleoid-associated protein YgaU